MKVELADANRQREQAYARLGEQVYASMAAESGFRAGREELIADVEACIAKCKEIEDRISGIEAEGAAARAAATGSRPCPNCGTVVAGSYKFCMNCGTQVPEAAPAGKVCPQCGSQNDPVGQFCVSCGAKLGEVEAPAGAQQPAGYTTAKPQQPAWAPDPAPSYETSAEVTPSVTEIKPERVE